MRNVPAALQTHLDTLATTLATCWRVVCQDGTVYYFTDHDIDLSIDGNTYEAATGVMPKALQQSSDLSVDNLDVMSVLDSSSITATDIVAGKFDFAQLDVFWVNWQDPDGGKIYLAKGWTLGEITREDNGFRCECRGLTQHCSQSIVDLYSPSCRADLGDSHCGVDLADSGQTFWRDGTVTSVSDNRSFTDSGRSEDSATFAFGKLTWTSGNNNGRSIEVKAYDLDSTGGVFELFDAMPEDIEVGDTYDVTFGCDKAFETCKGTFNNVANFRGEPHVPGYDRVLQVGNPNG